MDALGAAYYADVADVTPDDESGALRPSDAPVVDRGPYYLREWRGAALHGCPTCGYTGRSTEAVNRHRAKLHPPPPPALPVMERAARAGIILPGTG